jgi:hypothetical protein
VSLVTRPAKTRSHSASSTSPENPPTRAARSLKKIAPRSSSTSSTRLASGCSGVREAGSQEGRALGRVEADARVARTHRLDAAPHQLAARAQLIEQRRREAPDARGEDVVEPDADGKRDAVQSLDDREDGVRPSSLEADLVVREREPRERLPRDGLHRAPQAGWPRGRAARAARLAEQLAQLRRVDRERLRPALGQRRVALVDEVGDVREQQRARRRARASASPPTTRIAALPRSARSSSTERGADRRRRAGTRGRSRGRSGTTRSARRPRADPPRASCAGPTAASACRGGAAAAAARGRVLAEARGEERRVCPSARDDRSSISSGRKAAARRGGLGGREAEHDAVVRPDRLPRSPTARSRGARRSPAPRGRARAPRRATGRRRGSRRARRGSAR